MSFNNIALILNYNDSKRTIDLSNSLLSYELFDFILIINNYSYEENYKLINSYKKKEVIVLNTSSNLMYAGGINFGLNYLKNENYNLEYCLIINSDVIFDKKTIQMTLEKMDSNENVSICAPTMLNYKGKLDIANGWKKKI